jgi:hypothetical protein
MLLVSIMKFPPQPTVSTYREGIERHIFEKWGECSLKRNPKSVIRANWDINDGDAELRSASIV